MNTSRIISSRWVLVLMNLVVLVIAIRAHANGHAVILVYGAEALVASFFYGLKFWWVDRTQGASAFRASGEALAAFLLSAAVLATFTFLIVILPLSGTTDGFVAPDWTLPSSLWWAVISLAFSQAYSYVIDYVGKKQYLTVRFQDLLMIPLARFAVLFAAVMFGWLLSLLLGSSLGFLILLVLMKTFLDAVMHGNPSAQAAP